MVKKLIKDSVLYIQYWYLREFWRTFRQRDPLWKVIKYYGSYLRYNLDNAKSPLSSGLPWITFEAIDFLEDIVKPGMTVFEFGSGGSTRFFAERLAEVHSVEHHEYWYQKVANELRHHTPIDLRWIPGTDPAGNPDQWCLDESNDGFDYSRYAGSISKFEDTYFDLILVDGKARNACITASLPKLKAQGWLIVDNSNRKAYSKTLENLENWLVLRSFGPSLGSKKFTQTSFFKNA
ncbi:MAG: hypothetical protein WD426_04060 [Anditalea sp.]